MTLFAAILTLTASAAPAPAPGALAVDGLDAIEHVPLPAPAAGPLSLEVRALEALVVIESPARAVADLVRAIRKAPRVVCTGLDAAPSRIHLRCRSNRIVARLVAREGGYLLEIGETRGLPWEGLDGPALVAFDPASSGLGDACPGTTPAGQAECQLARGDRAAARATLERVVDGPALDLARLRLGDLALEGGDPRGAARSWERVQGQPWQRLAAARLCETSWACLAGARLEALYDVEGLPQPVARDMIVRRARAAAFLGRPSEAARQLLGGAGATPCAAALPLCRRVCLSALRAPGPEAVDGLLLWLDLPDRNRGAGAYEGELAAAAAAERSGAPLFAANVLAAAVSHAPPAALGEHLLRTSELYLAGGDRVRAGVVIEFARARAGKRGLPGPRWAAVSRAASGRGSAARRPSEHAAAQPGDDVAFLTAAVRSAEAARAALEGGRL